MDEESEELTRDILARLDRVDEFMEKHWDRRACLKVQSENQMFRNSISKYGGVDQALKMEMRDLPVEWLFELFQRAKETMNGVMIGMCIEEAARRGVFFK